MTILNRRNNSAKCDLKCSSCGHEFIAFAIGMVACPNCPNYKIFEQPKRVDVKGEK